MTALAFFLPRVAGFGTYRLCERVAGDAAEYRVDLAGRSHMVPAR
jgi:hypothetical protein